jgi:hypothetical protein
VYQLIFYRFFYGAIELRLVIPKSVLRSNSFHYYFTSFLIRIFLFINYKTKYRIKYKTKYRIKYIHKRDRCMCFKTKKKRNLCLSFTNITKLINCYTLYLSYTKVTDVSVSKLTNCHNLYIRGTHITNTCVSKLRKNAIRVYD